MLMGDLSALLKDDGIVIFSTLLSDGNVAERQRLTWWYASPRNGHISLYSRDSLEHLAARGGFRSRQLLAQPARLVASTLPEWRESRLLVELV